MWLQVIWCVIFRRNSCLFVYGWIVHWRRTSRVHSDILILYDQKHGFTSKEISVFIVTAARTSNLNKSQNVKHNATFLEASVSSVMRWIYIALRWRCTDETFPILYSKLEYVYRLYQNIPVSNIKKIPSAVLEFILTYRQADVRNILNRRSKLTWPCLKNFGVTLNFRKNSPNR